MSCPDACSADSAAAALAAAALGPKSVTTDGMTVESHPLPDLIALHRYTAGLCAAASPRRGLRFNTLVPDGAANAIGRAHRTEGPYPLWR